MEEKSIIFCHGNKEELKEFTGERYEYLSLMIIQSWEGGKYKLLSTLRTDAVAFAKHAAINEIERKMYMLAIVTGVDAMIHYSLQLTEARPGTSKAYAQGTHDRKMFR